MNYSNIKKSNSLNTNNNELNIEITENDYIPINKKNIEKHKDKFQKYKLPLMDKHSLHRETLLRVLNSNLKKDIIIPKGVKKISNLLDDFYNKNNWNEKLEQGAVNANWDKIMGETLSTRTMPKWSKNGKLTIVCLSPNLAAEVKYYTNVIYDKIKKYTNISPEIFVSGPKKL
jgi:hypothetical protein